ncbi:MAG: hypothetical protein J6X07_04065 [Prevotella sp.]|nr:hypothetical protein [Prevotella sp.]
MNQTEQLIVFGNTYIDALSKLQEDHPETVYPVLRLLDCVQPDLGYHLGILIEEPCEHEVPSHRCDQSWFHCYKGEEEPIMIQPYNLEKWKDGTNENMLYLRFTFEMFLHLNIENSIKGAWQTYLLCISKTLLPFSGSLYYTKRLLIFTNDQLPEIWVESKDSIDDKLERLNYKGDVSPSVQVEGNEYTISCCYWNKWRGLIRETLNLTFLGNGKVHIGDFSHQTLFKYDCGIRY